MPQERPRIDCSPNKADWFFGGVCGDLPTLLEDGDWRPYLPAYEAQSNPSLDTMSCVSHSRLNVLETLTNYADRRKDADYSDRFLAKMSGTGRLGNSFTSVDYSLWQDGIVEDKVWPWFKGITTWDEYYSDIPEAIVRQAKDFLKEWKPLPKVYVDGSDNDALREALKHGPLWVCSRYHAFMLAYVSPDGWKYCFDTYNGGNKLCSPDYRFEAAYVCPMAKANDSKPMPDHVEVPENCLVHEASGAGRNGLYVGGRLLMIDSYDKLVHWFTRNIGTDGLLKLPTKTVTTEQFDAFDHYDFKGNKLINR